MNSPYLLIPVILLSIILYSISFILFKTGIIVKVVHRKIWNSLLLVTFLVTALLGILLVVQINYKLEWSIIKTILKWHVNFGIGMSFVAIIHVIWHFSYYLKIFRKEDNADKTILDRKTALITDVKNFRLMIFLSGFISTVIQVLFLREITTIFQGNELTMAWALGIWMVLTGTGAFFGRNIKISNLNRFTIPRILAALAVLPFLCIVLMVFIKGTLFPTGVLIHPAWFLFIALLIFAPVGLLSGWLFSAFIAISEMQKKGFIRVFIIETIGCVFGGLAVTFIFIGWLSTLESILITSVLIFVLLLINEKRNSYLFGSLITVMVLIVFIVFPIENQLLGSVYSNQNIRKSIETRHGNITITENAGQFNIFENGTLSFTSDNSILSEEYVHYAMLQHKNPQNILLVAGGMSGMLKEISKFKSVKIIDYIEPNPQIVGLVSEFIPVYADSRIRMFNGDPIRFFNKSERKYDIVIMAMPDPTSLQINRFYTIEFITVLKEKIKPGGVVLYGISPAGNYLTTAKIEMEAALYNNLKAHFQFTEIVPGEKDYFVASDSPVSIKMSELSKGWENLNVYVNPYYMDDNSISQRNKYILTAIKSNKTTNTNEKPRIVFSNTLQYISMFSSTSLLIIFLPLLILLFPIFFMHPSAREMFITGVTASSVEITLIFIFQVIFGTVYSSIGILIAVFMTGLATGAFMAGRLHKFKHIQPISGFLLAVSIAIIPFCYQIMNKSGEFAAMCLIILNILIPAILIGILFFLYTSRLKLERMNAPGIIYAADLIGSAFGVILVTIFLLPVLGITHTCFILSGLNILPVIFGLKK